MYSSANTNNNTLILDYSINPWLKDVVKDERYFNSKFIKYKIDVNENTTRIYWNKTINLPFRYNDVYIADDKYILLGDGQDIKIGYDEDRDDS